MKNMLIKKCAISFMLVTGASCVFAGSDSNYQYLRSHTDSEVITLAFAGKPPFKNRHILNSKRREQAQQLSKANIEKTELSALEIHEKGEQLRKSTRKRYGHPFHRR